MIKVKQSIVIKFLVLAVLMFFLLDKKNLYILINSDNKVNGQNIIEDIADKGDLTLSNNTATSVTPLEKTKKNLLGKNPICGDQLQRRDTSYNANFTSKQDITTQTTIIDNKSLLGYRIGIDPGHQRKGNSELEQIAPNSSFMKAKVSSGTQGKYSQTPEYKLNLDVGILLKNELIKSGAKIVMTREINDINISNKERAQLTNEYDCDMVIRLHANGSMCENDSGYSILIPGEKCKKDILNKSKKFAEILDSQLSTNINIKSDGIVIRSDLTGFNWSNTPVILLEMGYMTNKNDDEIMQTEEFQNDLVRTIRQALEEFFKLQ